MIKTCPFNDKRNCDKNCPMFIAPDDLNEFVSARLTSLGVYAKDAGMCSLKMLALSQGRSIFENTKTRG